MLAESGEANGLAFHGCVPHVQSTVKDDKTNAVVFLEDLEDRIVIGVRRGNA